MPLNNPNVAFQNNVAATPGPGAPTTPTSQVSSTPNATISTPSQIQSVDATKLGSPVVTSSQLPPQSAYNPAPVPDINTITDQGGDSSAQQNYDSIGGQINALTSQLGGQSDYYGQLQSQYNTPQLTATANDITANIASLQAQRDSVQQGLKNQYGNDASKSYLQFEQQSVDSVLAAKQSAYAATLAAVNGKLSTAQTFIEQAVKNRYEPMLNQINALKTQAELVKTTLDKEQTKNLAVMQAKLADRSNLIAANRDISKTMLEKIAVAAANSANPAPSYIVSQAQAAALSNDPSKALDIIAPYLNDPNAAKLEIADIRAKNASADQSLAAASRDRQQAGLYQAQAASYGNPNLIAAVQNGEIDPSKINSRNLPLMSAFANAHVNVNQLSIDAASTKKVITGLQQQQAQLTQAGKALESNMELLASLSDKVNKLGIPVADTNLNAWQAKFSNKPDVVNYLSTLNTVRAEYAKYIARGSQVDDSVRSEAANAIPVGVNGDTLRSLLGVIQTEGANVKSSIDEAKKGQWSSLQGDKGGQVTIQGKAYDVGQTVTNSKGQQGKINADGTITILGPTSFNSVGGDTKTASVQIPQESHLAYVNNNPGNLKFVGQAGATSGAAGFAKFSSPQEGYNALVRQVQLDAGRGLTLTQFISNYAPPSENGTKQYIRQVAAATGTSPNTPISKIPVHVLAKAIAKKESSTNVL